MSSVESKVEAGGEAKEIGNLTVPPVDKEVEGHEEDRGNPSRPKSVSPAPSIVEIKRSSDENIRGSNAGSNCSGLVRSDGNSESVWGKHTNNRDPRLNRDRDAKPVTDSATLKAEILEIVKKCIEEEAAKIRMETERQLRSKELSSGNDTATTTASGGWDTATTTASGGWDSYGSSNSGGSSSSFGGGRGRGRGDGGDRGGSQSRAGDWNCDCGANNFARRTDCFKCHNPKPAGGDTEAASGGGWQSSYGSSNSGSSSSSFGGGRGRGRGGGGDRGGSQSRPGDWNCDCGANNFARRTDCFKCHNPKPAGGDTDKAAGGWESSYGSSNSNGARGGDGGGYGGDRGGYGGDRSSSFGGGRGRGKRPMDSGDNDDITNKRFRSNDYGSGSRVDNRYYNSDASASRAAAPVIESSWE